MLRGKKKNSKRIELSRDEIQSNISPFLDGVKLEEADMSCKMSGCEHDYTSNTYRMMVELWSKTSKLSDHFIIVKVDPATGFPKICGLR